MATSRLVLFARHVLTLDRPQPVEHGFVLVEGSRILQVGERRYFHGPRSLRMLDLGNTILLPGLINAHCHLDFTGLRGKVPVRAGFGQWLMTLGAWTRALTAGDYQRAIGNGIRESLAYGTTTLCDISTSFMSYPLLKESGIRAFVFFELLDLIHRSPEEYWGAFREKVRALFQTQPLSDRIRWGLAPHSVLTVSRELLALVGEHLDRYANLPVTMHLSESREEARTFKEGKGSLARRLGALKPDLVFPKHTTPLQYLNHMGWLPKLDMAVHANVVDEKDIRLMKKNRIAVVHCPGSHAFFKHPPFPYARLKKAGVIVCLGTDSLASNRSLSLFREMQLFRKDHARVGARETLELATSKAAQAMGEGRCLGRIKPGYLADLIGVTGPEKAPRGSEALFEHVVGNRAPVPFTMIHGEPKLRLNR